MTRLQREDGDEEQPDREVQLQQERSEDQDAQLPEGRREDQEDQDDGEGSDQDLPQQEPLQGQDDGEDEASDQDLSDQDSLPNQDDEGQSGQGALQAEQGGEEQEQSVQLQVGLGEQLQGRQDDQQVNEDGRVLQKHHLLLQSTPSASSSGALFPVKEKELEELYEKIREVWTLTAATRAFSAATETQNGAVIFQTDTLFLLARNGTTTRVH